MKKTRFVAGLVILSGSLLAGRAGVVWAGAPGIQAGETSETRSLTDLFAVNEVAPAFSLSSSVSQEGFLYSGTYELDFGVGLAGYPAVTFPDGTGGSSGAASPDSLGLPEPRPLAACGLLLLPIGARLIRNRRARKLAGQALVR